MCNIIPLTKHVSEIHMSLDGWVIELLRPRLQPKINRNIKNMHCRGHEIKLFDYGVRSLLVKIITWMKKAIKVNRLYGINLTTVSKVIVKKD